MHRRLRNFFVVGLGLALTACALAPDTITPNALDLGRHLGTGALTAFVGSVDATQTITGAFTAILPPLWLLILSAAYTAASTLIVKRGANTGAKCVRAVIAVLFAVAVVLPVIVLTQAI